LAVFAIKIFLETPTLKETFTAPSEACQSKRAISIKTFSWDLFRFIFSGLSSTIVMIQFRRNQPASTASHFTFLLHTVFFIISFLENLVLVTLPHMAPHLYPEVDCFTADSRSTAVWRVLILWFIGVIAQIIHYKVAHSWSGLNGPEVPEFNFEFEFAGPWSTRIRRITASQQGFKREKIPWNAR
jgi:hypothetical protein